MARSVVTVRAGSVLRIGNHAATPAEIAAGVVVTRRAFAGADGVAANPSGGVTIEIEAPDGTSRTYAYGAASGDEPAINESAGRFYADVAFETPGRHRWTERGYGTITASSTGVINVVANET